MNTPNSFGERVAGYEIPVLNEREIRAAAGILFFVMLVALMMIILKENFLLLKYFVTLFLADFAVRVLLTPRLAPTLIIGRMIVQRQNPEYVGAAQKKVAWYIGLGLATTMFLLMVVANTQSIIAGLICLICLVFLFFESAFGICLGCLFYGWFYKNKAQYCPGEICDVKAKQEIQKISPAQIGMVVAFAAFIVVTALLFNDIFLVTPVDLWSKLK